MGAKLSKKKKGYCLGAGKDGESTETTEVEQKETGTQEGQKDAAEPNGEKPSTDQTPNNDVNEEQKLQDEKRSSADVTSGDTTKDHSNKDQKPESNPSTEQKAADESNQSQDKPEHVESSSTAQEQACEGTKDVKSLSGDKPQTDCDLKEKESVAKDKETQESLPVMEQEGPGIIQPTQSVTKLAASAADEKEVVAEQVVESVTKMEVEKVEKSPVLVPKTEQIPEQATKDAARAVSSVVEPEQSEKVPEVVKPFGSENVLTQALPDVKLEEPALQEPVPDIKLEEPVSVPSIEVVEPILQESVSVPGLELAEPEPVKKSEVVDSEPVETPLPGTELVKSESDQVPEPTKPALSESVLVKESVVNEQLADPVAENVRPVTNPEPCPESEQVSEPKEEKECASERLPSNEVPDQTAEIEENSENKESLGCDDQVTNTVEIHATESAPTEQPSSVNLAEQNADQEAFVMENGPSEHFAQNVQITISTAQEVEDEGAKNEAKEEDNVLDKQQSTEQADQVGENDCKPPADVILETSKTETDQTTFKDTKEIHDPAQDGKSEDKTENQETPAEEQKSENESSAPQIIDKHVVGNGLPLKEEIMVHLENGSDKDLHELNSHGEGHEIQVCNE
ncbi:uncharacterized protein LOC142104385 [Mixophyes fleayi]|uniref:uncharacterized protein LOC142104385 n=1 Tax=Mixophyes fleayi TaxID=3061075 RepID=UPI003F4E0A3F